MNSLLQCFYYIKDFRDYFINEKDNFDKEYQPVYIALSEVMYGLKYEKNDYFVPCRFKEIMKKKILYELKDFFFNMLDKLLVELNTNKSFKEESSEEKELDLFNKLEIFREHEKELDKNIINDLFAGFYETSYYCQNNKNKITYSFQSEYFLLFEIEKIKNYFKTKELSIELCFSYYLRSQNKNSFFCNNCKKIEEGNCNEGIYRPPKILVLILDRGHGKIFDVKIKFNEYLDLENIINEENYEYSSCYQLICALNSKENYSSGIYRACCLTDNNSYYYFSDNNSIMIDIEKLFEDESYILF